MKQYEMKQIFESTVKGKNFMTPNVVRYEYLGYDIIAEVTSGSGMLGYDNLYGVTVIGWTEKGWVNVNGVNRCHGDMESVEQHIKQLKKDVETVENMSHAERCILIGSVEIIKSLAQISDELQDILKDDAEIDSDI